MNFHAWTHDGDEVMILRRIPKHRMTYNNFLWPSGIGAVVECPDWKPNDKCGNGLHGWPWGFGLGDGCGYDIINDVWLVIGAAPEDVVGEIEGGAKCKFRRGTIRYEGKFQDAMLLLQGGFLACVETAASAGDWSAAASVGDWSKAASSGDWSKAASVGKDTVAAVAGTGRVRAGENGAIAVCQREADDSYRDCEIGRAHV